MVREIENRHGDKNMWIRVVDRQTGQRWDVNAEWLKQHLGICLIDAHIEGHDSRLDFLINRVMELEKALINHKLPLARSYLADLFHKKGQINTRQLNSWMAREEARLDRASLRLAFESMVADGTLQFKKQGIGHPRLWFLKEG